MENEGGIPRKKGGSDFQNRNGLTQTREGKKSVTKKPEKNAGIWRTTDGTGLRPDPGGATPREHEGKKKTRFEGKWGAPHVHVKTAQRRGMGLRMAKKKRGGKNSATQGGHSNIRGLKTKNKRKNRGKTKRKQHISPHKENIQHNGG